MGCALRAELEIRADGGNSGGGQKMVFQIVLEGIL